MKTPQMRGRPWLVYAAMLLVAAGAGGATPYYVDNARPDDTGDGLSWATAKKTIQAAVDLTEDGDTVWVTNGTYNITAQISITNAIAVRGFSGNPEDTIVQRTGAGSHRIFYVDHEDAALEGLTIRNGFGVNGAGVYCVKGTIRRCIIRDNWHNGAISGIGAYMVGAGAVMEECLVANNYNTAGSGNNRGGGIYAGSTAVLISNSVIVSNRLDFGATIHGGGVRGGTLRNCLIAFNSAGQNGGGAFQSILENCTVTRNTAQRGGGGVNACTVRNSIVFDNVSLTYPLHHNWSGGTFVDSCATPLPAGAGNIADDPRFRDSLNGDFRLLPASPCIGTGNNDWVLPGANDLDGNERIFPAEGTVDMGCFEYAPGGLLGVFTVDARSGLAPLTVQFTATTDGTNTSGLVYHWDLDGDGDYNQVGADKASVSMNYTTPGFYTVSLLVSNAVGETHLLTRTDYITVSPAVLYVRPGGSHTMPYDNWDRAATDIHAAVALAAGGAEVLVSNHTYAITSQIVIERGMTVRGVNGAGATIVNGGNVTRGFFIDHPDAVLDGFTVTNCNAGSVGAYGSGIILAQGTIRNSRIVGNAVRGDGGGVYMLSGTLLEDSEISHNVTPGNNTANGNGVYCNGGVVQRCRIQNNRNTYISNGGGLYLAGGALARNCLITGNESRNLAGNRGYGGGVYGGTVENCTIVFNHALLRASGGGGTRNTVVTNSIVCFNLANTVDNNYSGGSFAYSLSLPKPAGEGNIDGDPLFIDYQTGNYRLDTLSPGVDSGTNVAWVVEEGATDLDGQPRLAFGRTAERVDMGAYERQQPRLECDFSADRISVLFGEPVVFTAFINGSHTDGLGFGWDFNNDGIIDVESSLATVTNTFAAPGFYSVKLTVTNNTEDVAVRLREAFIAVSPPILYVKPGGTHTLPYDTWQKAAINIQSALDLAANGAEVLVSNHTYAITSQIVIERGVTVRGVNGADATIVNGGNVTRGFFIDHPDAVLDGFTVTNCNSGATGVPGSGVYLAQGAIRNCRIVGNTVRGNGGGVYMLSGTLLEDSEISNNVGSDTADGNGVYCNGGVVQRCRIQNNRNTYISNGGGLYLTGGALARNCLITGNESRNHAGNRGYGGGVYGGTVENCTIVFNHALQRASGGGGTYNTVVTNSIVCFNRANTVDNNYSGGSFAYSLSLPKPAGAGNIDDDPLFVDAAGGNFRPAYKPIKSPAIDAGLLQAWMEGATDLDGHPRVQNQGVDMGAYETYVPLQGSLFLLR